MRTSGVFTTHSFYHKIRTLDPFNIYYVSDIHKHATLHNREKWDRFLGIGEDDKTGLFVYNGDYTEVGSTSERKALMLLKGVTHADMPKSINKMLLDQADSFCKDIAFSKGRTVVINGGNHDAELLSGMFMSQYIAQQMGAKWGGVCTLGRIQIDFHSKRTSITHYLHHGTGGGRSGNAINKVVDMLRSAEADVYIQSDSHTRTIDAGARSYLGQAGDNGELRHIVRDKIFMRTGSFLNGYVDGEGSYVTDMNLSPASLGCVKVRVVPHSEKKKVRGVYEQHFSCELIPEFV